MPQFFDKSHPFVDIFPKWSKKYMKVVEILFAVVVSHANFAAEKN